eukprot:jgi/Chlat1/6391/Chrsp44S05846
MMAAAVRPPPPSEDEEEETLEFVLAYLQERGFVKAEAALREELGLKSTGAISRHNQPARGTRVRELSRPFETEDNHSDIAAGERNSPRVADSRAAVGRAARSVRSPVGSLAHTNVARESPTRSDEYSDDDDAGYLRHPVVNDEEFAARDLMMDHSDTGDSESEQVAGDPSYYHDPEYAADDDDAVGPRGDDDAELELIRQYYDQSLGASSSAHTPTGSRPHSRHDPAQINGAGDVAFLAEENNASGSERSTSAAGTPTFSKRAPPQPGTPTSQRAQKGLRQSTAYTNGDISSPTSRMVEAKGQSHEGDAGDDLDDEEGRIEDGEGLQEYTLGEAAARYEILLLNVIHKRNRTGFEESKDFPIQLNSVIAGRYQVLEFLGAAAFSKAVQALDLRTGIQVCMKIIKNNKDFFDQSLDEIKLLKYVNAHDPDDKHHLLRLYDYFYYKEHLFIVCELLRANLYEFQKYNMESGDEPYFTMPRLQSITRQCLESIAYLHSLNLIHCDLKPENILIKSYSRCEVKVIDLGSSCFSTDHLSSYVQSRSYRAPEVILGLPYGPKIDVWSLGCILAELCSGNVLFQNDSLGTLLARVEGILGPFEPSLLEKGRFVHKYFTKNYQLFERSEETGQYELLVPKRSSLRHRLPCGDNLFVDFVQTLLTVNPDTRPSAAQALQHSWLSHEYDS